MKLLNNTSDEELMDSLQAELAKSSNELQCAQGDLQKVQKRINFLLVLANELKNRL